MKVELFTCTCLKDFTWLSYCLKSIIKNTTGFSGYTIVVPKTDVDLLTFLVNNLPGHEQINVTIIGGDEWPDKGMNWHMAQVMRADEHCPTADYIAHIDPDCVFTEPITPDVYFRDNKPILRFEPFARIGVRHPGVMVWKDAAEQCLPFQVPNETMRCHPEVYHRRLYNLARNVVEECVHQPIDDYIKSCKNSFPQGFCEYVTLGNVAMRYHTEQYALVEQTNDTVTPDNHLQQFWSHGALDAPQNIWVRGRQKVVIPLQMLAELGLDVIIPPP